MTSKERIRASDFFDLDESQGSLDFVDVDIHGDLPVFIDPRALRLLASEWGGHCVALVQDFFSLVMTLIKDGDHSRARRLLGELREPNETHLGLSRARAQGRALGPGSAHAVWDALRTSEAAKSGMLEDLEDSILMVPGISDDIVSDITTNLIRGPLIEYTQQVCDQLGIPMTEGVASGPLWNPISHEWQSQFVALPTTPFGKILLVPKVIVRARMTYDVSEYYQHYLLTHLQQLELSANTELVQLLKNGTRRVTKKSLMEKYGTGKGTVVRVTREHPEILERYRSAKAGNARPPLTHEQLSEELVAEAVNWDDLLGDVLECEPGAEDANKYHKRVASLLRALFYPALADMRVEREIHEGRKRIDISFANVLANPQHFFSWLGTHYPAPYVFAECKNYGRGIGNPEIDQLAGRFSPSRGQFGILVCRSLEDRSRFVKRCRDTVNDARGYIIGLTDEDLSALAQEAQAFGTGAGRGLLQERFDELVN